MMMARIWDSARIHDDYFVAIPHDPKDAEAERLLAELRSMTEDA
jgi:hypothetical protein